MLSWDWCDCRACCGVAALFNSRLVQFCMCPSAYHLKCLVNRANGHSTLDVTPNNFICPMHSNASISTQ